MARRGSAVSRARSLAGTRLRRAAAYAVRDARGRDLQLRRAWSPIVVRCRVTPATKYGRFSRLYAYAQAADQHVWVGGLLFMGRVCGVLLNSCVGQ